MPGPCCFDDPLTLLLLLPTSIARRCEQDPRRACVNSKVTGAAKPEHREEDKTPCAAAAAAAAEEEEKVVEEEASDPSSAPAATAPLELAASEPEAPAATAAPAAAATAEQEEKDEGAVAPVSQAQGVPPTPRTPAPQAAPEDGAGSQEEAGKEHVLVRVLSDGTLVPISTGGLKKVQKRQSQPAQKPSACPERPFMPLFPSS